jgi:hypothetical protein
MPVSIIYFGKNPGFRDGHTPDTALFTLTLHTQLNTLTLTLTTLQNFSTHSHFPLTLTFSIHTHSIPATLTFFSASVMDEFG